MRSTGKLYTDTCNGVSKMSRVFEVVATQGRRRIMYGTVDCEFTACNGFLICCYLTEYLGSNNCQSEYIVLIHSWIEVRVPFW